MVETARALAGALPVIGGKTIVLTGAMVPYAFGSSDGLFNLGSALSFVQVLRPGVYVAMNGRAFEWNRVRKNRETGIFEEIRNQEFGIRNLEAERHELVEVVNLMAGERVDDPVDGDRAVLGMGHGDLAVGL